MIRFRCGCGRQLQAREEPGHGVVDFVPYLREIKDLHIDGAVSIELEYSPEPARIVEWVREAYTATDRLMKEVGLRG
jgi:sugar phosphate isomerase/epimerase